MEKLLQLILLAVCVDQQGRFAFGNKCSVCDRDNSCLGELVQPTNVTEKDGQCVLTYGPFGGSTGYNFSTESLFNSFGKIMGMVVRSSGSIDAIAIRHGEFWSPLYGGQGQAHHTMSLDEDQERINRNYEIAAVELSIHSDDSATVSNSGAQSYGITRMKLILDPLDSMGPFGPYFTPMYCIDPGYGSYLAYISGNAREFVDGISFHFIAPRGYPPWSPWSTCDCETRTRKRERRCEDDDCPIMCPASGDMESQPCMADWCPEVDGCAFVNFVPCQNGGTCTSISNGYMCECLPDYTGTNCQSEIDRTDCSSFPCQHNATCIDRVNDYKCFCFSGFTGKQCETEIDECSSLPCQHGGTCHNCVNGYTCTCASRFTGRECDIEIFPCDENGCEHGGSCLLDPLLNITKCACTAGYSGRYCETDNCPCYNGGTCIPASSSLTCVCPKEYSGEQCQATVCLCQNGGVCRYHVIVDGPLSLVRYTCDCPTEFTGMHCENEDIDEGKFDSCMNGATRTGDITSPAHGCVPGDIESSCTTGTDPCSLSPCLHGGTCELTNQNTDTIEPTNQNAGQLTNHSTADQTNRNTAGFRCHCEAGYEGPNCQFSGVCPVGLAGNKTVGCYKFYNSQLNISDSIELCRANNLYVVTPDTQSKSSYLSHLANLLARNLLQTEGDFSSCLSYWTSGVHNDSDNGWGWVVAWSSAFDHTSATTNDTFTNWTNHAERNKTGQTHMTLQRMNGSVNGDWKWRSASSRDTSCTACETRV